MVRTLLQDSGQIEKIHIYILNIFNFSSILLKNSKIFHGWNDDVPLSSLVRSKAVDVDLISGVDLIIYLVSYVVICSNSAIQRRRWRQSDLHEKKIIHTGNCKIVLNPPYLIITIFSVCLILCSGVEKKIFKEIIHTIWLK